MAKEIIIDVKTKGVGKANKELSNLGGGAQGASEGIGGVGKSASGLSGPLAGASKGLASVNTAMLRLLANPIGLIIAAIALSFLALKKALGPSIERGGF